MREHPPLQTQQSSGTVVQLVADLDARRLDAVPGRQASSSMSRLHADADLVGRLAADGFEGPGWALVGIFIRATTRTS